MKPLKTTMILFACFVIIVVKYYGSLFLSSSRPPAQEKIHSDAAK